MQIEEHIPDQFAEVESSVHQEPYRQYVKQVVNGCFNLTRMGDSLKVFAQR
jgi:hypothetical protein